MLKSAKTKFKEMEIFVRKIMSSPLLPVQKIDAVKTFLLQSINFLGEWRSRKIIITRYGQEDQRNDQQGAEEQKAANRMPSRAMAT
jgi:hypothetical protein